VWIVVTIAQALREEFGMWIDAHPGGEGIEGSSINSALLAVARAIVAEVRKERDDPMTVLTHVPRLAALRRLTELGVRPDQAAVLVSSEPELGDSMPASAPLREYGTGVEAAPDSRHQSPVRFPPGSKQEATESAHRNRMRIGDMLDWSP
jgi:hypothetical protein